MSTILIVTHSDIVRQKRDPPTLTTVAFPLN
jgi:hypothetical protein